jgi:hypothetical protein
MRNMSANQSGGTTASIANWILRMDHHNGLAEQGFRERGMCNTEELSMPPYLCSVFKNDLIDAFASELPGAVWTALVYELEFAYLLSEQRLPRQGAGLRDVYFPADASIAVSVRSSEGERAIAHIGRCSMTPIGAFMNAEIGSPCQFEVERPGVAFSIRAEKFCEIVSGSEYLRSLVTAAEHTMRFRVLADMRLVRSLSGGVIRRMGE